MKIQEAIAWGTKRLSKYKKEDARYIAKKICAFLIQKDITYLVIHSDENIPEEKLKQYDVMLHKIEEGIPLQYITNEQNFMGLNFYVDENVLIPQPDTEILAEEVIRIAKTENKEKILDLCTGSGAIAVS